MHTIYLMIYFYLLKHFPNDRHLPCFSFSVMAISTTMNIFSMYLFAETCLVQFSHSVMSNSLWLHELQHIRPPCPSPTPRVHPNTRPLSQGCIQPFHPLSLPSPTALNLSQHQGLLQWVSSSHQVTKVLEF